jgi:hypothetical protein
MNSNDGAARQEIVAALLETKAVDFEAVGAALARFGPSLALRAEDGDPFCGVGKVFFHCYLRPFPVDLGPDPAVSAIGRRSGPLPQASHYVLGEGPA